MGGNREPPAEAEAEQWRPSPQQASPSTEKCVSMSMLIHLSERLFPLLTCPQLLDWSDISDSPTLNHIKGTKLQKNVQEVITTIYYLTL